MKNKETLFLTGVTGTLGKDLIKELLTKTEKRLFLLIRPKKQLSPTDRAREILSAQGLESFLGTRVQAFAGDVTEPSFGLTEADLATLRSEVDVFYHIAAITALNGSEEDCYGINLGGTQEALKIARDLRANGKLEHFIYFSTAYVAGSLQTYCALEDELPQHPAHANYYEASKYKAETKVREAMAEGLPVTIFRPSIVVGHSKTGEVSEFNVIYPFMKLFAHGILTRLPTRLDNSFNIVPIDFVIQAALAIAAQPDSIGKTFHLVTKEPPTIGMLLDLKTKEYPDMSSVEVIDPVTFKREDLEMNERVVYDMLSPYLGYLNDHLSFDMKNTEAALKGSSIVLPRTGYDFLRTITQYAVDAGYLVAS